MKSKLAWEEAIQEFSTAIAQLYGVRLKGIVLYGSRARGDAEPDSDIDLLVVLDEVSDFWKELRNIETFTCPISLKYNVVVTAFPISETEYLEGGSPLLINVRREGVQVA